MSDIDQNTSGSVSRLAKTGTLANRRIMITGATSGIGEALALKLAIDYKARIIAVGRRAERLEQLARRINTAGGNIQTHALSLTDEGAVRELCATLATDDIDDLVLNAGITNAGPFTDASLTTDRSIVDTNITANLQLIRELVPALSNGKTGGRILLVASLGGLVPLPYQSVYAGSKAFLINFGLSLRQELKAHGLCVLVFAPGGVATEMTNIPAMDKLRGQLADVNTVVDELIRMFIKRRSLVVPGWQNKLTALLARLLPRSTLASIAEKIYRA